MVGAEQGDGLIAAGRQAAANRRNALISDVVDDSAARRVQLPVNDTQLTEVIGHRFAGAVGDTDGFVGAQRGVVHAAFAARNVKAAAVNAGYRARVIAVNGVVQGGGSVHVAGGVYPPNYARNGGRLGAGQTARVGGHRAVAGHHQVAPVCGAGE